MKEVKVAVDKLRDDCYKAINNAKQNYIRDLGTKLTLKTTGRKTYWQIVNKCKIPRIPPLLIGEKFITNGKDNAEHFNKSFVAQCKPLQNTSS